MAVDRPLSTAPCDLRFYMDRGHVGIQYVPRRGNCYAAAEALFHILGGKRAGWVAMRISREDMKAYGFCRDTHWYLRHTSGVILDPSRAQFAKKTIPYYLGIATGFLTKKPSRKARQLMERLTWQEA